MQERTWENKVQKTRREWPCVTWTLRNLELSWRKVMNTSVATALLVHQLVGAHYLILCPTGMSNRYVEKTVTKNIYTIQSLSIKNGWIMIQHSLVVRNGESHENPICELCLAGLSQAVQATGINKNLMRYSFDLGQVTMLFCHMVQVASPRATGRLSNCHKFPEPGTSATLPTPPVAIQALARSRPGKTAEARWACSVG